MPLSARGRVRGSCWSSGIPSATRPLPLPGFLTAARARSGGGAGKVTAGRRLFIPGRAAAPAVRSVPEKRHRQGKTIWPPSFQNWLASGIRRKTELSRRHRFCPAATGWSGGAAGRVTCGRRRSSPAPRAAAVPSAPTGRFCRGKTIWPRSFPSSLPSGTPPGTGESRPIPSRQEVGEGFGGCAKRVMRGRPPSFPELPAGQAAPTARGGG